MVLEDCPAGIRDESLKRDHEQKKIIDFAEEWDEIRYEVEWKKDVSDGAGNKELVSVGDAAVSEQSAKEPQKVRQLLHRRHQRAFGT